jgi:hypothetical protein
LQNAFAILSQTDAPTTYNTPGMAHQMDDNKTIMPTDPRENRRQRKIARQQHIKQTLRRLRESDNLFLDNSITHAEDERTILAKNDGKNTRRLAMDSAHAKHDKPTIGTAQRGRNKAYTWGSAFKRIIKKINKDKHVSFCQTK